MKNLFIKILLKLKNLSKSTLRHKNNCFFINNKISTTQPIQYLFFEFDCMVDKMKIIIF